VPVRTTRPREVASGITTPFRPDLAMALAIAASPGWLMALWRNGNPRFSNLLPYVGKGPGGQKEAGQTVSLAEAAMFARKSMPGAFTWEEVARYRDRWKRPLVVKGILHPEDAEKGGVPWCRRPRGFEPWWPPDRGATGRDRRVARDRGAGPQPGDR